MENQDFEARQQEMILKYQQGNFNQAADIGERLVQDLNNGHEQTELDDNEMAQLAQCNYSLAMIYQSMPDLDKAIDYAQRSLGLLRHCYGDNSLEVAQNLNMLGVLMLIQEILPQAETYLEQALKIVSGIKDEDSQEYGEFLSNLAQVYRSQGRYEEAQDAFSRALGPKTNIYGSEHPSVAFTMAGLAFTYKSLGSTETAKWVYNQALSIMESTLPANHPDLLKTKKEYQELTD